jgi:GxxExxY protein
VMMPVIDDGIHIGGGFRADFVVESVLLLELKCVDAFVPAHKAQVVPYLRLSGLRQGLLLNFNAVRLKDGLKSILNTGEVVAIDDVEMAGG